MELVLTLFALAAVLVAAGLHARTLWRRRGAGTPPRPAATPGRLPPDRLAFLVVLTILPPVALHLSQRIAFQLDGPVLQSVRLTVEGPPITAQTPVTWRFDPPVSGPFPDEAACAAQARRIAADPAAWIPDTMPAGSRVTDVRCTVDESPDTAWVIAAALSLAVTGALAAAGTGGRPLRAVVALAPGLALAILVPPYPPWDDFAGQVTLADPIGLNDSLRDIAVGVAALGGPVLLLALRAAGLTRRRPRPRPVTPARSP